MPENPFNNGELLIQMVRDLTNKVDALPTRHEHDLLNARFDALESKMERYALQSEFNQYREFANQRADNYMNKTDERIDGVAKDIDDIKRARLPAWALAVILCILTTVGNVAITIYGHQQPPTQPTTIQRTH